MNRLTIRVEGGLLLASDDNGRTAALPPTLAPQLHHAFDLADAAPSASLTAGGLAALAEARATRPRHTPGPAPAWQDVRDGPRVPLVGLTAPDSRALADVLAARRSQRKCLPPRLEDLATVLVRCGRVLNWSVAPDGYIATHRPVPSAGGRHPLDLYLVAADVRGLAAGVWRFDALQCELVQTSLSPEPTLVQLGEVLDAEQPPACVVVVAHLQRTLSRYPTGLSLLWRDAGAVLAMLHLCAADVELASCIVGTCGLLVDDPDEGIIDVGAVVVGAQGARLDPN